MSITATIAANLSAWMQASAAFDTIKKVATRSHVGFGTVRRVRNGEGNPTITNLEDIARVFGKRAVDLLQPVVYDHLPSLPTPAVEDPAASYSLEPQIEKLVTIARCLNRDGQFVLLGRAQELSLSPDYTIKAKPQASSQ